MTAPPHETLYWRFGEQMAIRHGNHKLVDGRGVEKPMLFDLAADIGESKDLSAEKPEVVKDLQARYDAWNATLEQPRWGQPNRALGAFKNKAQRKEEQSQDGESTMGRSWRSLPPAPANWL